MGRGQMGIRVGNGRKGGREKMQSVCKIKEKNVNLKKVLILQKYLLIKNWIFYSIQCYPKAAKIKKNINITKYFYNLTNWKLV